MRSLLNRVENGGRGAASAVRSEASAAVGQVTVTVRTAAEKSVDWAVHRTGARLRADLVDDGAQRIVNDLQIGVFDALWPEVALEVKANVLRALHEAIDGPEPAWKQPPPVRGLAAVRAWFLYSFQPYDRSLFAQLRSPSALLLLVWSGTPSYGAQGLFWLLLFGAMDRSDEYWLVTFILSFKALQALSLGAGGVLLGCAKYYLCTTAQPSSCAQAAPGSEPGFFVALAGFALQSCLTWAALLLLPRAARRAGTAVGAVDEAVAASTLEQATARGERPGRLAGREGGGGYLRRMVAYDVCCFLVAVGWVSAYAWRAGVLTRAGPLWQFRATCYFAKTLYGLLSFPFLLFVLPPLNAVLTHARPIAYNQAGEAVPLLSKRQRHAKERAERGE